MFEDILQPNKDDDDIKDYDDHGFYRDNSLKEDILCEHNIDTCDCDDCVIEAIKDIANQLGVDVTDEDVEKIKKEYFDRVKDTCSMPIYKWLGYISFQKYIGGKTYEESSNF